jgi:nucleoporin GLE1
MICFVLYNMLVSDLLDSQDEIRNKISVLETSLLNESQNSISSLLRVEKFKETRQELDKKFDTQYQRQM